ncbi:MAG: ABC transporter permease [Nocardioides sp.]|uniref:ABC transporter permease n=1 Tax=Nocardioides sp. TaxID=35761 RepID=UPI0039E46072
MNSMTTRLLSRAAVAVWLPILLFVVWWLASANSESLYFPPLRDILTALGDAFRTQDLLGQTIYSVRNLVAGLALALVLGVVLGIALGLSEPVERATRPVLDYARAVPHLAFVPILIVILGIGAWPKIVVIALACIWPILLNSIDGARSIPPAVWDMTRSFRIPTPLFIARVAVPACLPRAAAGLRVALQVGLVTLLVSEMYGSDQGLGFYILQSGSTYRIQDTWAGTLLIGAVGYLLSLLLLLGERVTLSWHFRSTEETRTVTKSSRFASRKARA